jgi:prepilin-type N-terminal cleavage/methylation domain-containing protein
MMPIYSRRHAARGFTLVESIITLVILSLAALGIATLSGNIFNADAGNKDLQVGVQLMQECAEQVLAVRRVSGYATTPSCNVSTMPAFSGFGAPSVTTTAYTGAACPTGGSCKQVVISVTPAGGASLTPITLLLVGP